MENNRENYHFKILERCNWLLENDPNFNIKELTRGNVGREVLEFVYSFKTQEAKDKVIIKNFLGVSNESELIKTAKVKKEAFGKSVFELLNGTTKKATKNGILDICALLVDLQPRPYDKKFDYSQLDTKTKYSNTLDEKSESEAEEKLLETKQTNILSSFNSSLITKISGKINQWNFLSFGNKQEVKHDNND